MRGQMGSLPYKPERAAVRPAIIADVRSGELPAAVLEPCGIGRMVLVRPAARAMRAMMKAAQRDGVRLWASGTYRSYARQVALFESRYQSTPRAGARHEYWRGQHWWLKAGVAGAAVPGTSNHGLGLSADLARKDTLGRVRAVDRRTLDWLAEHGPDYGWFCTISNGARSGPGAEPWHWCYCLGDRPAPAAVLAEESLAPVPVVPQQPPTLAIGCDGDEVRILQMRLNARGAHLLVDGTFGPRTDAAVRAFQQSVRLVPNGIVASETWAALA